MMTDEERYGDYLKCLPADEAEQWMKVRKADKEVTARCLAVHDFKKSSRKKLKLLNRKYRDAVVKCNALRDTFQEMQMNKKPHNDL